MNQDDRDEEGVEEVDKVAQTISDKENYKHLFPVACGQMPNAKEQINNLLFMILPGNATLLELDDLAGEVYARVHECWNKHIFSERGIT